jgi:lipopolysaccharide transport system ATP-binding protein
MIAGLIRPDAGVVRTRGRVVPLLALGAGFNPVLSGRENIAVNMAILGVPRAEIRRRMDEVIAFAEIPADALDAPVRTYSSGMSARLGFACAIHTDPDVLLIDEVLAVGDMAFRAKCYRKLADLRKKGTGFILVSHSSQMVTSVCDAAMYLVGGAVAQTGPVLDVMQRYEEDLADTGVPAATRLEETGFQSSAKEADGGTGLEILDVCFEDASDAPVQTIQTATAITLRVRCRCYRPQRRVSLGVYIRDTALEGGYVLGLESARDGVPMDLGEGTHDVCLTLNPCGLVPGYYSMKLYFAQFPMHILDVVEQTTFRVQAPTDPATGVRECRYFQPRSWQLTRVPSAETAVVGDVA